MLFATPATDRASVEPKALVRITSRSSGVHGTGFIVHHEGPATYVVTCRHVVDETRSRDNRGRVVLVDEHEARSVTFGDDAGQAPAEDWPDLEVLRCVAPELRERRPLRLGQPLSMSRAQILSYQGLVDDRARDRAGAPDLLFFDLAGESDARITLKNDRDHRIEPGHSGSPVIDFDSGLVVGVVEKVAPFITADSNEGVVVAAPIKSLARRWPGIPRDLIAQPEFPLPVLGPRLAGSGRGGGPVRLRLLLAVSPRTAADDDVDEERFIILETISRTLLSPTRRQYFDAQVFEWAAPDSLRPVLGNTRSIDGIVDRPSLEQFDAVVFMFRSSHRPELPGSKELDTLEREANETAARPPQNRPRILTYRQNASDSAGRSASAVDRRPAGGWWRTYPPKNDQGEAPAEDFARSFSADYSLLLEDLVATQQPRRRPAACAPDDLVPSLQTNPYRGLAPYGEDDGDVFYGRAAEVKLLRDKLAARPRGLVAVVGGSGCGKSSLVRAGLLYQLRIDAIPGSAGWIVLDLRLSQTDEGTGDRQSPLWTTALTFLRQTAARRGYKTARDLERDLKYAGGIANVLELVWREMPAGGRLVLLVDQFEELFTLFPNDDDRRSFARFLVDVVAQERPVNVVLTLRVDFYPHVLGTELAPLIADGWFPLAAPNAGALWSIIVWPAAWSDLHFEDTGLPVEILRDAGGTSGSLPLLSYALEQLAERATPDRVMTREAYRKLDGVRGVVQRQADDALEDLPPAVKSLDTQNQLFRRLVNVDDRGTPTKQPAVFDPRDPTWTPELRQLQEALVNKRLLHTEQDGNQVVTRIAHEALLLTWSALTEWVGRTHDALILMQRVERATRDWVTARNAAVDFKGRFAADRALWPQEQIDDVNRKLALLGQPITTLSPEVQAFLRPESERLVASLDTPIEHSSRAQVGERLAQLNDPRPGVGLRNGLPDIAWCPVPGGSVTIADPQTSRSWSFEVASFQVSLYPVTVRQFSVFLQPANYLVETWWQDLGIDPRKHPPYTLASDIINHPAQYVSWYQAVAFCNWLGAQLGYRIRLPNEWEWVQAATGGHAHYNYPWGPTWNPDHANHAQGVNHLMSVGMYPAGRSPVGAFDMTGNMYQWCLNEFAEPLRMDASGDRPRTSRGGAFFAIPSGIDPKDQLSIQHRLPDQPSGTRESGQRIRVCIRLVRGDPPPGTVVSPRAGFADDSPTEA